MTLDGVGGAAGACEEEGESVAKVAELVEVRGAVGLAIEEGDGLEEDEDDVGCVGAGPGDGVASPGGFSHPEMVMLQSSITWAPRSWLPNPGCRRVARCATLHNLLRPFREHVEVGALLPELLAVDGVGVELAGADHVPVISFPLWGRQRFALRRRGRP